MLGNAGAPMSLLPGLDDPETAPFWEAAKQGKLLVQTCNGRMRAPPRPGRDPVGWTEVSGRGTIWSFIVVHAPTIPAFSDKTPFPVALIELAEDENLRMVGNLIAAPGAAINSLDAASISIGQKVRVCFEPAGEGVVLPCWTPA